MKAKFLLLFTAFVFSFNFIHAQTITGTTIQPAGNNSINVYTNITLRTYGHILGHNTMVSNDTIFIKICSGESALAALRPVTDTATVTIDPSLSHYFLSVKGYFVDRTGNCDYTEIYDSVFYEFNTPVTDSTRFLSVPVFSAKDDVVIYPNPTREQVTISGNCVACDLFYMVNQMGQRIYEAPYNHTTQTVNMSYFSGGVYFLYFRDKDSRVMNVYKLLKE